MEFTDAIKQHMNPSIVYTNGDEPLTDVIFKMSDEGTDLAVVRTNETIIGVITETDIFYALVTKVFTQKSKTPENVSVQDVMREPSAKQVMESCETYGSHPCVDTFEDDTIENAIRIMQRSGLHHLLVFDKNNKLVGTLSSHDIIISFCKNKK